MWDWSRNAIIVNVFLISDGNPDIIEEAIYFFKANVFFKSYEIKVFILVRWYVQPEWVLRKRFKESNPFHTNLDECIESEVKCTVHDLFCEPADRVLHRNPWWKCFYQKKRRELSQV